MKLLHDSHLRALVSLLTDDNPRVLARSQGAVRELAHEVVPYLEEATRSPNARLRARARQALEEIRIHGLLGELRCVAARLDCSRDALEDGCILVARCRYPDLDASTVRAALDAMADGLASRIPHPPDHQRAAEVLGRFFGFELGFRTGTQRSIQPADCYLHRVLERRRGIALSLSIVYLLVARRLKLPLRGIGLPGHFVLRYGDGGSGVFLDPTDDGRILTRSEIGLLARLGGRGPAAGLEPTSDGAILLRLLRRTEAAHARQGARGPVWLVRRLRRALLHGEPSRE